MSKKRAGWEAVDNLVALEDVRKWVKVEKHWDEPVHLVPLLRHPQTDLVALGPATDCFTQAALHTNGVW